MTQILIFLKKCITDDYAIITFAMFRQSRRNIHKNNLIYIIHSNCVLHICFEINQQQKIYIKNNNNNLEYREFHIIGCGIYHFPFEMNKIIL